jgi:hypothetical protein
MIRSLWPSLPSLLCLPYSAPSRTPHCWGTFHVIIEPRSLRFSGSVRLFSFVHHWMLFIVVLLLCAEPSIRKRATRCRSMRPPPCEEIRGGFSMNAKRGLGCGALPCVSILNLRSQCSPRDQQVRKAVCRKKCGKRFCCREPLASKQSWPLQLQSERSRLLGGQTAVNVEGHVRNRSWATGKTGQT